MPVWSRRLTNRTMTRLFRVLTALVLSSLALLPGSTSRAASTGASCSTWLRGWLMPGHDPQRTSRSDAVGPAHPRLLFQRPSTSIEAVGPDGAMVGSGQAGSQSLVVDLSPKGQLLWRYPFSGEQTVIEPNGTVVTVGFTTVPAGSADAAAVALSAQGKLLWKIQQFGLYKGAEPLVTERNVYFAPVIGPHDGSPSQKYIGLNLISSRGWVLRRLAPMFHPALDQGNLIVDDSTTTLRAVDRRGHPVWKTKLQELDFDTLRPVVAADGTIFTGYRQQIVAYTSSGHLRWRVRKTDGALALALRADGILLVAGRDRLDAIRTNGTRLWSTAIGYSSAQYPAAWPSLATDAAGKAYVGSGDGRVRVVSATGQVLATVSAGGYRDGSTPSLLLGPDGRLMVSGADSTLRVYG